MQRQNIIRPGGVITSRGTELLVEPSGAYTSVKDIGRTVISLPKSNQVAYLRDVATVRRATVDPPKQLAYFNGRRAIAIAVSMIEGENIVGFGKRLRARVAHLQNQLPLGFQIHYATAQAPRVDAAISDFSSNLYQTIAVVLLVVVLALGLRTGLIVGTAVPLTMLMAIIIMRMAEVELQRVSIAALIISLGMLVDNGIVVAEDIKRRLEAGIDRRDACIAAGKELALPLLTSSLTTILAFSPLLMAENSTGEFLRSLAIVILITLLSSWFLAMFATPLFAYFFMRVKPVGGQVADDAIYDQGFYAAYKGVLATVLRLKYLFMAAVLVVFVGALMLFPLIPVQFMPASDRNQIQVNIDLPAGASSRQTAKVVESFSAWLKDKRINPEVNLSAMYVAYGGPRFFLALSPIDPDPNRAYALINTRSNKDLPATMARIRKYFLERQPNVRAGVKDLFLGAKEPGLVEYRFIGPDSQVLREASKRMKRAYRKIGGTSVLQDDWDNKTLTIQVKVDQSKARRAGITSDEIATALNYFFSGDRVTDYREGDNVIPIVLRGEAVLRFTLDRLLSVNVFSSRSSTPVPLVQMATFDARWDDSRIQRRNLERTLTLTAKHQTLLAADLHARVAKTLAALRKSLPEGYRIELGGELESAGEANAALLDNMPIALLMILLLLVWQFNSIRRMAIISLTIPLSLIGAILGLLVMQAFFGFTSLLGILSLAGIIINNAIVLIDRIELERQRGAETWDAILSAGARRLRPILVTTLTTVLGLLPLLLFGGALWYGMAVVIMFGLAVGTMLTLGVVPALYAIFFRVRPPAKSAASPAPNDPHEVPA
jgi:multidrug efflux pump subunit AcrB